MIKLKELIETEPAKPPHVDKDTDFKMAMRQPFTAWEYACRYGPDPRIRRFLTGTPFEKLYNKKFGTLEVRKDPRIHPHHPGYWPEEEIERILRGIAQTKIPVKGGTEIPISNKDKDVEFEPKITGT